ncbi:MAG: hypothetical protein E6767_14980 [Dysgonomonas sp.]|nr:hypothetical protein [Dysgonomonas sp.]
MPIVIKEIHINTTVEKKVIQKTEIPEHVYQEIKEEIIRELSKKTGIIAAMKKNER